MKFRLFFLLISIIGSLSIYNACLSRSDVFTTDIIDDQPSSEDEPIAENLFDEPQVPNELIFFDRYHVYMSFDNGTNWEIRSPISQINKYTFITSVAKFEDSLAIGTSFEGIWLSRDRGLSWIQLSNANSAIYQGAKFYDEVSFLTFQDQSNIIFRNGFTAEYIRLNLENKKEYSELKPEFSEYSLHSPNELYRENWPKPKAFENVGLEIQVEDEEAKAVRRKLASDKKSIYFNRPVLNRDLAGALDFALEAGLNSIVIDLKDELGRVIFDSNVPFTSEIFSRYVWIDLQKVIEEADARGLYVIGRIVSFKDPILYRYDSNQYALWNRVEDAAYAVYRKKVLEDGSEENELIEHWIDPYNPAVSEYLIDLAKDAVSFGVDEIQFDYIRFPSDGPTSQLYSRYYFEQTGSLIDQPQDKIDAITAFLRKAREAIDIPISVDLYGFNTWARMGFMGQDLESISHYVDVVCPMAYPSHYPITFLPQYSYIEKAEVIYEEGVMRADAISNGRVLIRPWVQAFLLGDENNFSKLQYQRYLSNQITGALNGGASGFLLWNNSGNYYMVDTEKFPELHKNSARH
jgi:hypothetical protein